MVMTGARIIRFIENGDIVKEKLETIIDILAFIIVIYIAIELLGKILVGVLALILLIAFIDFLSE